MVFKHHNRVTMVSTLWQTVLYSILAEGRKDLSEENIQDLAKLLVGEQKAITAQIPTAMKELVKVIKCSEKWQKVATMAPDKVPAWLESHNPSAFKLLQDIVQQYQHRNNRELDVMTKTWGLDCKSLVAALKASLKTCHLDSWCVDSIETREPEINVIDQLKSPLKPFSRWLLRRLLGVIRSEASRREVTKDACLRVVHQFRLGFLRLAQLMRAEGKLPSAQLIWFCTHYELTRLLNSPHPVLLHKIARRQQLWKSWDRHQFPEVMVGLPTPKQDIDDLPVLAGESWVQGTMVCAGSVRGRACVLLSCAESHTLQQGDVLVTHSTDVGWTPLFPLLGGVVTELGGLISHGAVVAREFGLPCIVGATKATLIFKTGDLVYLDGKTGRVQKCL